MEVHWDLELASQGLDPVTVSLLSVVETMSLGMVGCLVRVVAASSCRVTCWLIHPFIID